MEPQTLTIVGLVVSQVGVVYTILRNRRRDESSDAKLVLARLEAQVRECHDDRDKQAHTIDDLREQIIVLNAKMVKYLMQADPPGADYSRH